MGGGLWGVLSVPLFHKETGILYTGSLYSFRSLGWNILGVVVITVWSVAMAFLLFIALHLLKQLRVSEEVELKGENSDYHHELVRGGWLADWLACRSVGPRVFWLVG